MVHAGKRQVDILESNKRSSYEVLPLLWNHSLEVPLLQAQIPRLDN